MNETNKNDDLKNTPEDSSEEYYGDQLGSFSPIRDGTGLQAHYPTAKTAIELHQDDLDRQELFKDRLPKLFRLKIAFFTSIVFGLLLLFSAAWGKMWSAGETGSVFQSFGLGLGLAFVAWLSIRYVNKIFYAFAKSPRLFWVLYGAAVFSLYALSITGLFGELESLNLALVCGVHFVMVFVLLLALLRTSK